jgi:hypothetical protein
MTYFFRPNEIRGTLAKWSTASMDGTPVRTVPSCGAVGRFNTDFKEAASDERAGVDAILLASNSAAVGALGRE